jgi:hypothetical protein
VGAAEGGQDVIQRFFVGEIDDLKLGAPFITIAMEQIVVSDGGVEQIPRCDARRIMIVILGSRCRDLEQR